MSPKLMAPDEDIEKVLLMILSHATLLQSQGHAHVNGVLETCRKPAGLD